MNCTEFEDVILEVAREETRPAAGREAALFHAGTCGRCAARLAEEQSLTSALRALTEAFQHEQAPWTVEAGLREAFTASSGGPAPAVRRWRWVPVAVAAAVLLAAGVSYRLVRPPRAERAAAEMETAAGDAAVRVEGVAFSGEEFVPFLYGDDLNALEAVRVIRVEIPREALSTLGVPVNEDRRADRVEAEVLLGEDGLARAIRLAQDQY